jgi:hypothetical protein
VNYRGDPFTQSLFENIPLLRTVQGLYGCLLLAVGGGLEPLNDLLQLAPFPNKDFQASLVDIISISLVKFLCVTKQRFPGTTASNPPRQLCGRIRSGKAVPAVGVDLMAT